MKRGLLILTFVSIIILGALHHIASAFYLYWEIPWFDMLMHFIGGASVALFFIWSLYGSDIFGSRQIKSRASVVLAALVFVLIVSGAWEIFEYKFDIANPAWESYPLDTFTDTVSALLGSIVGGVLGTLRKFYE